MTAAIGAGPAALLAGDDVLLGNGVRLLTVSLSLEGIAEATKLAGPGNAAVLIIGHTAAHNSGLDMWASPRFSTSRGASC
ncbi:MAG TPA: hypothetical protein VGL69_21980 [Solirubrobacteraceae bacterium]